MSSRTIPCISPGAQVSTDTGCITVPARHYTTVISMLHKVLLKRRADALKDEVKGMKKKLPKRAPTEWSAFKHEHRGEKLSPAAMSALYKTTSKEEKKELLERYKEFLASKAEEEESD